MKFLGGSTDAFLKLAEKLGVGVVFKIKDDLGWGVPE
jgi:hypothetical protein